MSLDKVALWQRAQDDASRIALLVLEQISNPTQSNIDAIVSAAGTTNSVVPKPTYSLDGESYQWESYLKALQAFVEQCQTTIVFMQGPFQFIVHGR